MTFTRIGGDVIDYFEEVQDAICVKKVHFAEIARAAAVSQGIP